MDFALALFGAAADPAGASALSTYGTVALNILLVILGINALIIVHEFGHFIVARACGVRCEKFYIWFDFWGLKFFKFKWGDTEYGLGVFPLGGYVKMLGQEDNPGELRAEMERAKQASSEQTGSEQERLEEWTGVKALKADGLIDEQEAKELTGTAESQGGQQTAASETTAVPPKSPEPTDEQPTRSVEELQEEIFAPDSYLAKSVPQRMAIICAGVIMNFLFAIVCATGAYLVGFKDTAPSVGAVIPGSPAWEAGLEVGDRITAIDGNPIRVFTDINMSMVGAEKGIMLSLERPTATDAEKLEIKVFPRKRENDLAPSMGVMAKPTLELAYPIKPEKEWSPVYKLFQKYYSKETLEALNKKHLVIRSVDGTKITRQTDFLDTLLRHFDKPVECVFTQNQKTSKNPPYADSVTVTIPAIPMKEIGVRFRPGAITSVLPGSDAEKKGVKPGDIIVSVDGDTEYDPLKLPQTILRKVNAEETTVRLGLKKAGGGEETVTVELAPIRILPKLASLSMKDPVGSSALGLAWGVDPVVAGVASGSEAEKLELPAGGEVVSILFRNCDSLLNGKTTFAKETKEGYQFFGLGDKIDLPYILDMMLPLAQPKPLSKKQKEAGESEKTVDVELEVKLPGGGLKKFVLPIVDSTDHFETDRGLKFIAETADVKIDNFGEALRLGTGKMVESSLSVFYFLERLIGGGISPKALGGPVAIVQIAYAFVEKGLGSYLLFLCLIGANLGVINILPIPVLDGGHVVFLAYEGITGRAPNETVQVVLSYMGLALILGLMVWVVALDIGCILRI